MKPLGSRIYFSPLLGVTQSDDKNEPLPSYLDWRTLVANLAEDRYEPWKDAGTKPTKPGLSDEWEPTNRSLWERILQVAQGKLREYTLGERTIHAPNNGRGFYPWPHPNGTAWAVKQYNGFNGGWQRQDEKKRAAMPTERPDFVTLNRLRLGAVLETQEGQPAHETLMRMKQAGLAHSTESPHGRTYWDITRKGRITVLAGLGNELERKMTDLLQHYDEGKAKAVGKWLGDNFRVQSPKTPKGQKVLKEKAEALRWYLSNGGPSYLESITHTWERDVKPHLSDLVRHFTDEGGSVVPKELSVGGRLYVNEIGVPESTLKKYAARLEVVFKSIKGWRAKALQGTLKVVLASPRNFNGTVSGKYKSAEDALYIRATPSILKRGGNTYASFEYIIVHEVGHRYDQKNRLPADFSGSTWWTTKYSRTDERETFAELYAIGHFNLTGSWDSAIIERFERVMTGKGG